MSIRSPRDIPLPSLGRLPLGPILFAPFCLVTAKTERDPFEIPESVRVLDRAAIAREQPTNL